MSHFQFSHVSEHASVFRISILVGDQQGGRLEFQRFFARKTNLVPLWIELPWDRRGPIRWRSGDVQEARMDRGRPFFRVRSGGVTRAPMTGIQKQECEFDFFGLDSFFQRSDSI